MRYVILCLLLLFPGAVPRAAGVATARPILVLGDSLSAAHNIPIESGWVALLEQRLRQAGLAHPRAVINASISGETTAGGLARLPGLLAQRRPALVLVELGANDGLRGLPITEIRTNLEHIVSACREAGAKVILLGIVLPVNYGPQYRGALSDMYRDIATEFNVPLVPFLLAGVATDPKLMQDDGLHPLAAGEPKVLDNVWPTLKKSLDSLR